MKIEDLMCGKVIAVIGFISVTITEIYLSHQNGKDSGAVSKSLSTRIHISKKMLRTSAHTIFFAVMMVLLCLVCQMYRLRMITSLFVAVWAVMDEVTKPMMKNGRHCVIVKSPLVYHSPQMCCIIEFKQVHSSKKND